MKLFDEMTSLVSSLFTGMFDLLSSLFDEFKSFLRWLGS